MKTLPPGFAPYDTADYLSTEADISEYLKACSEYDDPKLMLNALNVIARVRNKAALAREVGMSRPGLYRALTPGANPSFSTVQAIVKGLGLKITFDVASAPVK
jgi:probable addiction module antidote protein